MKAANSAHRIVLTVGALQICMGAVKTPVSSPVGVPCQSEVSADVLGPRALVGRSMWKKKLAGTWVWMNT